MGPPRDTERLAATPDGPVLGDRSENPGHIRAMWEISTEWKGPRGNRVFNREVGKSVLRRLLQLNRRLVRSVHSIFRSEKPFDASFMPFYTLVPNKNVAYLGIFKVATTSVKMRLAELANIPVEHPGVVNQRGRFFTDVDVTSPQVDEYFKFTFVRHPLGRVVSVWTDKLAEDSKAKLDLSQHGMYKGMPFAEYIEKLVVQPKRSLDRHLLPQAYYVFYRGTIRVDFIGRLETVDKAYRFLQPIIGDESALPKLNCDDRGNFESYFTPRLRQMAEDYYVDDLRLFGYG